MRKSIQKIQSFKRNKKITVLTAYDFSTAKYIDEAGVDAVLVGDSLASVALGYQDGTQISMDEMKIFTGAVSRGVKSALLVSDMPYGSFQVSKEETIKNALLLIRAGANAVKLEGCSDFILESIEHLTQNGIPVLGHIGFTPMNINSIGGHKIQGKEISKIQKMLDEARKLEKAGCFAVVLELVPKEAAEYISQNISIPTIGIGAGAGCDGQVLVSDDLFGKFDRFTPKFVRKYANLKEIILNAAKKYCEDVEAGVFPNDDESFLLEKQEVEKLENYK